jgi:hypothetical protein
VAGWQGRESGAFTHVRAYHNRVGGEVSAGGVKMTRKNRKIAKKLAKSENPL